MSEESSPEKLRGVEVNLFLQSSFPMEDGFAYLEKSIFESLKAESRSEKVYILFGQTVVEARPDDGFVNLPKMGGWLCESKWEKYPGYEKFKEAGGVEAAKNASSINLIYDEENDIWTMDRIFMIRFFDDVSTDPFNLDFLNYWIPLDSLFQCSLVLPLSLSENFCVKFTDKFHTLRKSGFDPRYKQIVDRLIDMGIFDKIEGPNLNDKLQFKKELTKHDPSLTPEFREIDLQTSFARQILDFMYQLGTNEIVIKSRWKNNGNGVILVEQLASVKEYDTRYLRFTIPGLDKSNESKNTIQITVKVDPDGQVIDFENGMDYDDLILSGDGVFANSIINGTLERDLAEYDRLRSLVLGLKKDERKNFAEEYYMEQKANHWENPITGEKIELRMNWLPMDEHLGGYLRYNNSFYLRIFSKGHRANKMAADNDQLARGIDNSEEIKDYIQKFIIAVYGKDVPNFPDNITPLYYKLKSRLFELGNRLQGFEYINAGPRSFDIIPEPIWVREISKGKRVIIDWKLKIIETQGPEMNDRLYAKLYYEYHLRNVKKKRQEAILSWKGAQTPDS